MTAKVSDLTVESSEVDNIQQSYDPLTQTMVMNDHNTEILHHDMVGDPLVAMKAQSDPDTMYHHQAMLQWQHGMPSVSFSP